MKGIVMLNDNSRAVERSSKIPVCSRNIRRHSFAFAHQCRSWICVLASRNMRMVLKIFSTFVLGLQPPDALDIRGVGGRVVGRPDEPRVTNLVRRHKSFSISISLSLKRMQFFWGGGVLGHGDRG